MKAQMKLFVAVSCLIGVFIAGFYRLFLGIDFTDESFYASTTYRFLLGDQPFIHDLSISQVGHVLGAFFVKIINFLSGSPPAHALILKLRFIEFAIRAFTAFFVFKVARGKLHEKIIFAAFTLAYTNTNVFGLSYNSIANSFLAICILSAVQGIESKNKYWIILSAFALAMTGAVYPTFCLVVPIYLIFVWFSADFKFRKSAIYGSLAGFFIALVSVLLLTGIPTVESFSNIYQYLRITATGRSSQVMKVFTLFYDALDLIKTGILGGFLVGSYAFLKRIKFKTALAKYIDLYLVILILQVLFEQASQLKLMISFFMFLSVRAFLEKKSSILFFVFGLTMVFCLTLGISSNDGTLRFGLGTIGSVLWYFSTRIRESAYYFGVVTFSAMAFSYLGFNFMYRERPRTELIYKIEEGAFAHLWTSAEKRDLILDLTQSLKSVEKSYEYIFVYDKLPGGYLMSSLRPATHATWVCVQPNCNDESRKWYIGTLQKLGNQTLVVEAHVNASQYPDDSLRKYVRATFNKELLKNKNFTLFSR
jgi:hypothetical protein